MKIKDALHYGATELGNSMESRILLCFATDYKLEYLLLHPDEILPPTNYGIFYSFVERRKKHEPIAYILGYKEFYGRDFVLNKMF
ncbi:MAG UNVERIFIED_CONTAM: hypothetical protein LVQ98_07300 [Rickettsiaceae bacterium]|jgi:release factor glutamine methyltransferase